MFNLFKASLYKLFREKTFLITMIIGTGLAIFIPLLYKLLSIGMEDGASSLVSGHSMLISSVSVGSNFGLTVPINLSVLVVAEFTTGTLRNKIIAGYRKSFIYLSLLFSGIVFTFIMMIYYVGLSVLMGTIFGGFNADAIGGAEFIIPFILVTICSYIFVATFSTFVASNIRHIGGSLPILIVALTFMNIVPLFIQLIAPDSVIGWAWAVPVFSIGLISGTGGELLGLFTGMDEVMNNVKIAGIVSPLIYSAALVVLGIILFKKRDVK